MAIFKPDLQYNRITDIPLQRLRALGVRGLALDVDNTLANADAPEPFDGVREWLFTMQQAGMKVAIVSNNVSGRVMPFAQSLALDFTCFALKPLPLGFIRVAKSMGLKCREVAAIGDQLFTDMAGGNLCGMVTVLVAPARLEDSLSFRVKRRLERILLRHYNRKK